MESPEEGRGEIDESGIKERAREIARIAAEIREVKREIEAGREDLPEEKPFENNPDFKAFWDEMSRGERLEWLRGFRQNLEDHRDEIAAVPGGDEVLERLAKFAKHQDALIRLNEEAEELALQTQADEADATARLAVNMADLMQHWENFTEEQWQEIDPAERGKLMDLLNEWRNGERENCLSKLPIEIRRRYED